MAASIRNLGNYAYARHFTPLQLFNAGAIKIAAPMVRYSKLPFRSLVREYGCDLTFTPMIVANSFVRSEKARDNEFVSNEYDRPLITQFAANNAEDFAGATELVARYCDGVDLNCGCPQRWAMREGYGAHLLDHPEIVKDIVCQTWNRLSGISKEDFTISIKIRIDDEMHKTVELCRRSEMAGISFITVHARTKEQRNEPVNLDAIRLLTESVRCPLVANGDIKSLDDCVDVFDATGAKGVMVARKLLTNPALFAGFDETPIECIGKWIKICSELGTQFTSFHHHLMFMCEKLLPRVERRIFNAFTTKAAVVDYLNERFGFTFVLSDYT